jgi:hypothetical protein
MANPEHIQLTLSDIPTELSLQGQKYTQFVNNAVEYDPIPSPDIVTSDEAGGIRTSDYSGGVGVFIPQLGSDAYLQNDIKSSPMLHDIIRESSIGFIPIYIKMQVKFGSKANLNLRYRLFETMLNIHLK